MNTGSVIAQFTVTLTHAVTEPVLVEWFTSDGTAVAGIDYAENRGTVTFAPGQTERNVEILVYGRPIDSPDVTFFVNMLPPLNAILGAPIGEVIIHVDTSGTIPVAQIIVATGPVGQKGDKGDKGDTGDSAYEAWLALGNTGTEQDFIDSLSDNTFDRVADAISAFDGALTGAADETPVPAHGDPVLGASLNSQAQALLNRQEKIKEDQRAKNTLFGSYNPPIPLASERLKIIAGGGAEYPGKFFVITQGGGGHGVITEMVTGNVAAPSLPSSSENGSWELWRTGTINAIECAYVYKTPTATTGVWSVSSVIGSAVDISSTFGFGTHKAIKRNTSAVNAGGENSGAKASFSFKVQRSGKFTVAFMGTATAPQAQQILLDGTPISTVDLRASTPSLLVFEFRAAPGNHVLEITHTESSTNLNVIGVNFLELSELQHWDVDVSSWAAYTVSPGYVTNRGASEYAIKSVSSGNWAGSYHGGEIALQDAEFGLDHRKITISDSLLAIGRSMSVLQQTQLNWTGGESMNIDSLTVIGDAHVFMQCCASSVNVSASTAYLGMSTTSPAFDSAFGTRFFGAATEDGANYEMGPCQQVTQIERGTGRVFFSEFSIPPLLANSFGGMTVSYASGAYAKIYPGFVRNINTQLPAEFSWSNIRKFS